MIRLLFQLFRGLAGLPVLGLAHLLHWIALELAYSACFIAGVSAPGFTKPGETEPDAEGKP